MQKPSVRKRFRPAEREKLLAAYRQSRLTQREFAIQNGLSVSCLSVWLRGAKLAAAVPPRPFLRLPGGLPVNAASGGGYKIEFPGGMSLGVAPGFVAEELAQLCEIVRGL